MALNQVYKFVDVLSVPVPEGTESGDPVVLNAEIGLVGVAETVRGGDSDWSVSSYDDPYAGGNWNGHASVSLQGAYRVTVVGELEKLAPVYFAEDGTLTAEAGGVRFGWALTPKGAGEGEAVVVIDGAPAAA